MIWQGATFRGDSDRSPDLEKKIKKIALPRPAIQVGVMWGAGHLSASSFITITFDCIQVPEMSNMN